MYKDLMTVRNYAYANKITPQYVYRLIEKGVVKSVVIDGVKFIKIEKDANFRA